MSPSDAPVSSLLRDLGALEARHRDVSLEDIRERLEADPPRGWRLFVEKYSRFVWSVALQLSRGLDDPEEFAAEIYRRVFVRLEKSDFALLRGFEGRCDFRTYLYRIVRTERFRLFRRRGVERGAQEVLEREAAAGDRPAPSAPPWSGPEARQAVRECLDELSEEDRQVLVLRFATGLKLRELVEPIGARDLNDAAYRLRRALSRCSALARAREGPGWNEDAFRAAASTLRETLFARPQNVGAEVSHRDEPSQEGEP
jgi:RNA polymerase sigma factor (sigma-70 family)